MLVTELKEYLNYLSSHIEYEHILLDIADMFDKDCLTEITIDQLERLAKLYDY
jgi:hypothetical protein